MPPRPTKSSGAWPKVCVTVGLAYRTTPSAEMTEMTSQPFSIRARNRCSFRSARRRAACRTSARALIETPLAMPRPSRTTRQNGNDV